MLNGKINEGIYSVEYFSASKESKLCLYPLTQMDHDVFRKWEKNPEKWIWCDTFLPFKTLCVCVSVCLYVQMYCELT